MSGAATLHAMFSLEGRTALVTGARTGLGRAMAGAIAVAGADVVLLGRGGGMAATAADVRAAGRSAWEVAVDLAEPAAVPEAARAVLAEHRVDILVNNAGIIRRAPAAEHTRSDFDAVLDVNLESLFLLTREIGAPMLERGAGKVVNVASLLSFQGGVNVVGYTASKHAVAGLTKALANEWAPRGVQVNAIAPGYFATNNTEALRADPERAAAILDRIPAGRWGRPDDLAAAAVLLCGPGSDYMAGHVLAVDGGWLAR
ncbi:2-deoxy-D-gluconate 3-dehydrogenase [Murinocardiopsis flavida]|uniref:2-deoxy-D-gluconate 3-dehydrogenase n=1 Tax=Murinocardiopsis flavida TaxID=645275 RepID=A0A2P8DMM4_9ACTN|nr:SDR family oxidoreductase [Murinocardiopsis flavida]PSK98470.1 2-deoxy-D-gluconate 3-dehydrogenase [Murinocardiopsis flavida]